MEQPEDGCSSPAQSTAHQAQANPASQPATTLVIQPPTVSPNKQQPPTRSPGSPQSPTTDRKQIRRRKKLSSREHGASNSPTGAHHPSLGDIADDDPPTAILLPPGIKLPITIQHLFVPDQSSCAQPKRSGSTNSSFSHKLQQDHHVSKTTPLFSYFEGVSLTPLDPIQPLANKKTDTLSLKGKSRAREEAGHSTQSSRRGGDPIKDADSGPILKTYESPVKGHLIEWCIEQGQVLREQDGWRTRSVVKIKEPCTHSVQWHGQCAICGSDLTIADYTGISETSRASIPMSHGPSTLTVSISEAQRLESETRRRLLKDQKLSLIVDLDQTIVHATVDPTVGEWMADPKNPNWAALQGVGRFRLNDGSNVGNESCYYYLKQRPGLSEFLHTLADRYEMHVYTMGTRAYADAVCQIIDPTGQIFGGRILSRDESGSMTQKSITRLFPVDTSMVVIIDDRGDVWEYSPNLVSVVPYNFFVGIGDINGAFLPPARQLDAAPPDAKPDTVPASASSPKTELAIPVMTVTDHSGPSTQSSDSTTAPLAESRAEGGLATAVTMSIGEASKESVLISQAAETSAGGAPSSPSATPAGLAGTTGGEAKEDIVSTARSKLIAEQVQSRPLKQKQIELEEAQRVQKGSVRKRGSSSTGTVASHTGGSSITSKSGRSSRAITPVAVHIAGAGVPSGGHGPSGASNGVLVPIPLESAELTPSTDPSDNPNPPAAVGPESTNCETEEGMVDDVTDSDGNTDCSLDDYGEFSERAVLVDHDEELKRLGTILGDIHIGFYSQDRVEQADVRDVISALKHDVLQGIHLAFSSLWPMDAIPDQQDAWKLAEQFGASCYTKLTTRVTHLVAAKLGTTKVNTALSRKNLAVVKPKWLFDAVTLWTRPNEAEYSWRTAPSGAGEGSSGEVEIDDDNDGWGAEMKSFDWKDAAEEVMAALDESDSETASGGGGRTSSSDEGTARGDEGARKRARTSTGESLHSARSPGSSRQQSPEAEGEVDSPLLKRQRVARSRSSKLKLVVGPEGTEEGLPNEGSSDQGLETEGDGDSQEGSRSRSGSGSNGGRAGRLTELSAEEDEFLSALAAEMEGSMNQP